jgi:hypothetical protein
MLREKLFRHGITMQDLFQEAAEMAVNDGVKSEKLLEKIAKKKLVLSLEKSTKNKIDNGTVIDSEVMYNLLEDNDEEQSAEE